jgi:tRNA-dihydrouridine synthase
MIGRAAIGYPWIFREIKHYFATGEHLPPPTIEERVAAAKEHLAKSIVWKGEKLGILEMRRHYTNYFRGLRGVKSYRTQLVTANGAAEVFDLLDEVQHVYG